jgi:hypothetical protein
VGGERRRAGAEQHQVGEVGVKQHPAQAAADLARDGLGPRPPCRGREQRGELPRPADQGRRPTSLPSAYPVVACQAGLDIR